MGINSDSDVSANLQIGPTSLGMVRLFVQSDAVELPLDFEPEEAEEIADELRAAAQKARAMRAKGSAKPKPGAPKPGAPKPAPRSAGNGKGRGR